MHLTNNIGNKYASGKFKLEFQIYNVDVYKSCEAG